MTHRACGMSFLVKTCFFLIGGYLFILVFVYFMQGRMLFMPVREMSGNPGNIGLAYEELTLTTQDGVILHGWYIVANEEKGIVLFCHGNAGNISHRLESIKIFHELGFSVLIFDYRGYGKSSGRPSEAGTYLDAEAAWDYLVLTKRRSPKAIVIFGRSLGAAVAAEIALRKNPACLILESAFTSVPDMGAQLYPWLPVRLISRFRFSTIEKVGEIRCPKLIIFSPDDEIVPAGHGEEIYRKALSPKELLKIKGDHNTGFLVSGSYYTEGLKGFLSRSLGATPG
jgi:hypothetical protein